MSAPNPISKALQEKLNTVELEVRKLHFKWIFFVQLFADPKRVQILNATACSLFQSVEESMLFDILLSITRLTDPPKSSGQENLSFANFIQEIPDGSLRTQVESLLCQVKEKTKEIRIWRDKKLSHNDLQNTLGSFPLPPIQKKDLTDSLDHIRGIMNRIHGHFSDTTVLYEQAITSGDGDALLFYIRYGLDAFEEDKRNRNIDRIRKLRSQAIGGEQQ
jgi:hypothetical protein